MHLWINATLLDTNIQNHFVETKGMYTPLITMLLTLWADLQLTIGHTKLKCFSYFKLNLVTKWLLTKNNFVISTTYYTYLKTIPTVPLTQHQSSCLWWQTKCFCSAYFTLLHCMEYYFVIFIWIVGWFFQRNKWKGSLDRVTWEGGGGGEGCVG